MAWPLVEELFLLRLPLGNELVGPSKRGIVGVTMQAFFSLGRSRDNLLHMSRERTGRAQQ